MFLDGSEMVHRLSAQVVFNQMQIQVIYYSDNHRGLKDTVNSTEYRTRDQYNMCSNLIKHADHNALFPVTQ